MIEIVISPMCKRLCPHSLTCSSGRHTRPTASMTTNSRSPTSSWLAPPPRKCSRHSSMFVSFHSSPRSTFGKKKKKAEKKKGGETRKNRRKKKRKKTAKKRNQYRNISLSPTSSLSRVDRYHFQHQHHHKRHCF